MSIQTDNLEATSGQGDDLYRKAIEWLGGKDSSHWLAGEPAMLAAFARSLAPSGAVVEAMREAILQARAAAHNDTVEGRYTEYRKWDTDLDEEHKEQFDVLASTPSVEPTVDEQVDKIMEQVEDWWTDDRDEMDSHSYGDLRERLKALLSK